MTDDVNQTATGTPSADMDSLIRRALAARDGSTLAERLFGGLDNDEDEPKK